MTTTLPSSKVPATKGTWESLRRSDLLREFALIPVILGVMFLGWWFSADFLTWNNLVGNVMVTSAVLGVVVVAESIILISGYFDLSLESIVGICPMLAAWLVVPSSIGGAGVELPPTLAVLIGFAAAGAVGIINGLLVSRLKLNAFIVTLAMLTLLRGITMGISGGQTLSGLPDSMRVLGTARLLGVSIQVWIFLLIFALAWAFMRNHPTGRKLYAMGGSEAAAGASGINTKRLTLGVFVVGALLSCFAGFMLTGRIASATSGQGEGLIFTVFATAVIGGISLQGGKGSMVGALLGVVLLGLIENILTLSQVPSGVSVK